MPDRTDQREAISGALKAFESISLTEAARKLFAILGYQSDRCIPISTPKQFFEQLDPEKKLTERERDALKDLKSLHLLFQLTDAELAAHGDLFEDAAAVQTTKIESYLFFAVELPSGQYNRTALSTLVRAINKPLAMPSLILFRHGETISLGIIHRRLHKRDQAKDVLEKVTLIKDVNFADPIRAHLEILNDFALANLDADFGVSNFVRLHEAWQKRLGAYALSSNFYREIADWYFWAHHQVDDDTIRLPQHCDTEQEKSIFLIRLLTRVIFCWFLIEKRIIPADLFREHRLRSLLKQFQPSKDPKKPDTASTYYHAILQNLFFGTLNMPVEQRSFREKKKEGERYDKNYGITNLWRYENDFHKPADWINTAQRIPFLNGGLFDCLDDKSGKKKDNFVLDGFSDRADFGCYLPNDLFFGPERPVDLSKDYGEEDKRTARSKKAKVRGLIQILSRYKFTIEENTPLEEEIALDPELLGKVFENLLASYNEDTRTTARKALGAFYTPREIVSYMVDEALKSYLATQVPRCKGALDDLFSNRATLKEIKSDTRDALIAAIGRVKILDPACGSGAFPMGALHRLVDLLQKLDPNNESWKRDRLTEARRYRKLLEEAGVAKDEIAACDARIADIEKSFDTRFHALDFARKLYLIENGIYGVDIQPIATQIAKLRFFISLVVDQKVNMKADNLGVRPLPNLETRLVAADTLIPIPKAKEHQGHLFDDASPEAYRQLERLKAELTNIRHEHFNTRSPAAKRKWRDADEAKRTEIADLLKQSGLPSASADKLAAWDPYDQNAFASFFDSEWMFGLPVGNVRLEGKAPATLLGNLALINEAGGQTELTPTTTKEIDSGFDVVIGNPPYVRMEEIKHYKDAFRAHYICFTGRADLYVYFYEAALRLLRSGGIISFITSNKYFRAAYGDTLRQMLVSTTHIQHLIDFGDAPVFTAIAYPSIIIAQKLKEGSKADDSATVRALLWEPGPDVERFAEIVSTKSIRLPQAGLVGDAWRITGGAVSSLIERLRNVGTTLREFSDDRIYRGVVTGLNDAFIISSATRTRLVTEDKRAAEIIKPFLRGRDLKRWAAGTNEQWLIYTRKGIDISRYPSIAAYMRPFKRALEERATKQEWYELQQPQYAYSSAFESPKVIYPDIYEHQSFALDLTGSYLANTCYFLPIVDKWLCGVLNSSIVEWFYSHISNSVRGGYLRAFTDYVRQIPIPNAEKPQRAVMDRLVDFLIILTRHPADGTGGQTSRDPLMLAYWERVLNGLVYELYFPEEVHGAGLRLFDLVGQANLPDVNAIPERDRLPRLRKLFETLHDGAHPLRIALDKLQTLDTVRIIEGKE
ncbi:MAG: Eco57I restriction-modification methylase domain-containing protein [Verrucomicrobia bacterium]|nr:Eco57I restriction-modification methylase domain-containing protein [Verrucomicrobiota bacterium]